MPDKSLNIENYVASQKREFTRMDIGDGKKGRGDGIVYWPEAERSLLMDYAILREVSGEGPSKSDLQAQKKRFLKQFPNGLDIEKVTSELKTALESYDKPPKDGIVKASELPKQAREILFGKSGVNK